MKLTESIRDWNGINTTKRLRGAILNASKRLKVLGYEDLSDEFQNIYTNTKNNKARLKQEQINAVLFGLCIKTEHIND